MKKNSVNKILLIGAILIVVESLLGFVFLGVFSASNSKLNSEVSTSFTNEGAADLADEISRDLTSVREYLSAAVSVSGGDKSILSSAEFLDAVTANTSAGFAVYIDENMVAHTRGGESVDLSGTVYIDKLKAGKILYANDNGFGELKPSFVVPVKVSADGNDFVAAYIDPFVVDEIFKNDPSYSSSFYVLVGEDHNTDYIAGKPGNLFLAEGVLWENLRKFSKSQDEWNRFSSAYDAGEQYILEAYQAKITRHITFAPVKNTEWKLVVGYDVKYISNAVSGCIGDGKVIVIQISLVLMTILISFAVMALREWRRSDSSSKELTGKAETDLLTGVLNKLATETRIKDYIASNPNGQGVFILIDVDNFKRINDKMGHAFGDEVLRNLGLRLKTLYRATDIVGRIGGDEFIVFLKDISDMGIIEREARKLEVFFRDFEVGEYTKYSVNASLGATIFPVDGQNFESLYKNADSALYYVKQNGKNKLVFYKQDEKFPIDD